MFRIFLTLAATLCLASATTLTLDGDLTGQIKQPNCTFVLNGSLQNLNPSGTSSGSLKLVLWATLAPFPAKGYRIAEYNLAPLPGLHQFNSFRFKAPANIPMANGQFYFTVAVLEYTTAGWRTVAFAPGVQRRLNSGDLIAATKWALPTAAPLAPPASLAVGSTLTLTPKANTNLYRIATGTRSQTIIQIAVKGKATIKIADKSATVSRSYSVGSAALGSKTKPAGNLTLTQSSTTSRFSLFYLTTTSGVYKETTQGRITWGTFSVM